MEAYAYILAISLSWFGFVSFIGARLVDRNRNWRSSQIQLLIWVGMVYSQVFSVFSAACSAAVLLSISWVNAGHGTQGFDNLWLLFALSVLPWVAVALAAGAVAALITRFEPMRLEMNRTTDLLKFAGKPSGHFRGLPIRTIDAPFPAAALLDKKIRPTILITTGAIKQLSDSELEAVYWHEMGHALGQHNGLNRIARIAGVLAPPIPLNRRVGPAVGRLCEEIADKFALEHVSQEALTKAHAAFDF